MCDLAHNRLTLSSVPASLTPTVSFFSLLLCFQPRCLTSPSLAAVVYLAEDRILCWELVSKRESSWTLHYVKSESLDCLAAQKDIH
jgi:cellulose synthase/poly-beta-1,6-N-acetylglucosamine synthase-like glycosyltransferase